MTAEQRFLQPLAGGEGDPIRISFSAGIVDWLVEQQISLACTSYRSGQLILLGVDPQRRLSLNHQNYARAMGLHFDGETLFLASLFQIWRLRNMLRPGEYANGANDCILVPRSAHTTGYVDAHDIGIDSEGTPLFVSSLFSCVGAVDDRFSFAERWRPPFTSALAPEDRCHLNGLAMRDGQVAYATALGSGDGERSWRRQQPFGGVLIDAAAGEIVANGLAMPHSPRLSGNLLLVLESGEGRLLAFEAGSRTREIFRFPAFLRGMALYADHAIVGASALRLGARDIPIVLRTQETREQPWCGLLVVHLTTGAVRHWIRFEAGVEEIFDVAALPGWRNPASIGPATEELLGTVRPRPD